MEISPQQCHKRWLQADSRAFEDEDGSHLDGVWWSGCDPFFFAPSLYVSKTPEITTFRWLVHNLNFYPN